MIVIYEAENAIDAHLLRGLLEQQGIEVLITGELLLGGIGDLPAHGLVRVLVRPEDVAAARATVVDFEDARSGAGGDAADPLDHGAEPVAARGGDVPE